MSPFRLARVGFALAPSLGAVAQNPASAPSSQIAGPRPALTFALSCRGLPETGIWTAYPLVADVNGDGAADIVALARDLNEGLNVWLGDGHGTWRHTGSPPLRYEACGGGVAAADLNRDGHVDVVAADACHGLFVFLGDGSGGSWRIAAKELTPADRADANFRRIEYAGVNDVAIADVDGDGQLDLIAVGSDRGGLHVWRGDGTGKNWAFQRVTGIDADGRGWCVRVARINSDVHPDLVVSWSAGPRVLLGDGHGAFRDASQGLPAPQLRGLFRGLDIGDLNGDGRADLALAHEADGPLIFLQQPDGTWQAQPEVFPAMFGGAVGIAIGDLDRDGHADLALNGRLRRAAGIVYGVYVLLGDGRGRFRDAPDLALPRSGLLFPGGLSCADIDADGRPDLICASGGEVGTVAPPALQEPLLKPRILVWRNLREPAGR